MAIASQTSWIRYTSTTYKFSIKHPADWTAPVTPIPGWDSFFDRDGSNLVVTWRAVTKGTTLATVTDEIWNTMNSSGYTVVSKEAATIVGQPAQVLTVDGNATTGQPRHGTVGILVTATGRYRIELWTRPGADAEDITLFNMFVLTFAIEK